MSKIKGIIFDMDGTLVDSIELHYNAWKDSLAKYGFEMTKEYFDEINGMATPAIAKYTVEKFNLAADPETLAKEKRVIAVESLKNGVKLFPKVKETLVTLRRLGYVLGLATSSKRQHMEYAIGPHMHDTLEFEYIVTEDEIINAKPDPEIFLKCAEGIGIEPKNCIVIEDAANGVKAAKEAGMKCVAITYTSNRNVLVDAGANVIINSIDKLSSGLIEQIENLETETNGGN